MAIFFAPAPTAKNESLTAAVGFGENPIERVDSLLSDTQKTLNAIVERRALQSASSDGVAGVSRDSDEQLKITQGALINGREKLKILQENSVKITDIVALAGSSRLSR